MEKDMKMNKKGQFFIMSIVLIALAIFMLITYYLTIDETTVIRSDSSSRIQVKNIQNIIDDPDNCQGNITLCNHLKDMYGGKFNLDCSELGEGAPFNYSITFNSADTDFSATLTQDLICVGGGGGATCGNGILEGGEICDSERITPCTQPGFEIYFTDSYVEDGVICNGKVACDVACSHCETLTNCNSGV
jgi:hypothetical protein